MLWWSLDRCSNFNTLFFANGDCCAIIRCMSAGDTEAQPTSRHRSFLGVGLAVVLAAAAFFSGLYIGQGKELDARIEAGLFSLFYSEAASDSDADMSEFWRVWDLLEQKFVSGTTTDELTTEEKVQGAIAGLVDSYDDPYTVFLPPTDAEMFEEDISGNFSGVGMEVGIRNDVITVIAPLPDTPADQSGVLAGDVIVRIDGTATDNMSIDEAVRLIRGEKGTEVVLTIYREGATEFEDIAITRDTIAIPTVKTEEQGDVFIITLYSFNALSDMKMQEALRSYVVSGKEKLILDMRGNPGGFLQSAISIASYFVPAGKPVVRESFGDGLDEEVYRSAGKTLREYAPKEMVVLVDGGSASASEIVAGALQEHDIATLMGEQTFGKGSVQELVDLPSGSSLKVTVARWFTPNGISISAGGLTPDIIIRRTVEQRLNDEDPQLNAALRLLAGEEVVSEVEEPTESDEETEAAE